MNSRLKRSQMKNNTITTQNPNGKSPPIRRLDSFEEARNETERDNQS